MTGIKLDRMKIYQKIFSDGMYGKVYDAIDDTDGNYRPIPYQENHEPKIIIITVCRKTGN